MNPPVHRALSASILKVAYAFDLEMPSPFFVCSTTGMRFPTTQSDWILAGCAISTFHFISCSSCRRPSGILLPECIAVTYPDAQNSWILTCRWRKINLSVSSNFSKHSGCVLRQYQDHIQPFLLCHLMFSFLAALQVLKTGTINVRCNSCSLEIPYA